MMRSIPKLFAIALVASLACAGVASAEPAGDEPAIRKLLTDIEAAFNKPDTATARVKALLVFFTPDFELSGGFGNDPPRTRAQVEALWTRQLETNEKTSKLKLTLLTVRFVKPDVAYVELDQENRTTTGPDGKPQYGKHRDVGIVMKKSGKWLFADLHQFPYPEQN